MELKSPPSSRSMHPTKLLMASSKTKPEPVPLPLMANRHLYCEILSRIEPDVTENLVDSNMTNLV
jgi:hypothetical protein